MTNPVGADKVYADAVYRATHRPDAGNLGRFQKVTNLLKNEATERLNFVHSGLRGVAGAVVGVALALFKTGYAAVPGKLFTVAEHRNAAVDGWKDVLNHVVISVKSAAGTVWPGVVNYFEKSEVASAVPSEPATAVVGKE